MTAGQRALAGVTATPYRADRMDHEAGRQIEAGCDPCLAARTATNSAAGGQQPRPGRAMNRAIHTTTAEQAFIGSIDDRVHAQRGDIGMNG